VKTASCYLTVLSKISCATALVGSWKFNTKQLFPHRISKNPVHFFFQDPIKISSKEIRTISFQSPDSIITNSFAFLFKKCFYTKGKIFLPIRDIYRRIRYPASLVPERGLCKKMIIHYEKPANLTTVYQIGFVF
jgi:hypothetical protein